jgi:hypothetical protein
VLPRRRRRSQRSQPRLAPRRLDPGLHGWLVDLPGSIEGFTPALRSFVLGSWSFRLGSRSFRAGSRSFRLAFGASGSRSGGSGLRLGASGLGIGASGSAREPPRRARQARGPTRKAGKPTRKPRKPTRKPGKKPNSEAFRAVFVGLLPRSGRRRAQRERYALRHASTDGEVLTRATRPRPRGRRRETWPGSAAARCGRAAGAVAHACRLDVHHLPPPSADLPPRSGRSGSRTGRSRSRDRQARRPSRQVCLARRQARPSEPAGTAPRPLRFWATSAGDSDPCARLRGWMHAAAREEAP